MVFTLWTFIIEMILVIVGPFLPGGQCCMLLIYVWEDIPLSNERIFEGILAQIPTCSWGQFPSVVTIWTWFRVRPTWVQVQALALNSSLA